VGVGGCSLCDVYERGKIDRVCCGGGGQSRGRMLFAGFKTAVLLGGLQFVTLLVICDSGDVELQAQQQQPAAVSCRVCVIVIVCVCVCVCVG
jgi:hypothetical protein